MVEGSIPGLELLMKLLSTAARIVKIYLNQVILENYLNVNYFDDKVLMVWQFILMIDGELFNNLHYFRDLVGR